MSETQQDETFRQLVRRFAPHARLLRTWPLTGGVSAQVTGLEIERADGRRAKLIVRQHGNVDLSHNPHIARDEFRLLRIARSRGLAVPKAHYVDESGDFFPTPVLVIDYVEGETEFAPVDLAGYLSQMATQLVRIHGVPDSPELAFLPRQDKGFGERPAIVDTAMGEDRIRDDLESAWPLVQTNPSVLLHGDYWPGNILWQDGRLAAVIDWEDARVGDPLSDLGNTRLEILWAFGPEAMRDFTSLYISESALDLANLPYWNLCAALRPCGKLSDWGLDEATARRMREHHALFVTSAIEELGKALGNRM
jgi:aminoglycoside phosphotransferase (APT) family kinase protein